MKPVCLCNGHQNNEISCIVPYLQNALIQWTVKLHYYDDECLLRPSSNCYTVAKRFKMVEPGQLVTTLRWWVYKDDLFHKRHCIWVLFLPTEWFCVIDLFDRFSTNFNITEYEKSEDNHSSISRTCLSRTWPVVDKVELWYKVMRISSFFIYVSF